MVEPGDIGTLSWYILLKYLDICIIDKTQDIWPSQNMMMQRGQAQQVDHFFSVFVAILKHSLIIIIRQV